MECNVQRNELELFRSSSYNVYTIYRKDKTLKYVKLFSTEQHMMQLFVDVSSNKLTQYCIILRFR